MGQKTSQYQGDIPDSPHKRTTGVTSFNVIVVRDPTGGFPGSVVLQLHPKGAKIVKPITKETLYFTTFYDISTWSCDPAQNIFGFTVSEMDAFTFQHNECMKIVESIEDYVTTILMDRTRRDSSVVADLPPTSRTRSSTL